MYWVSVLKYSGYRQVSTTVYSSVYSLYGIHRDTGGVGLLCLAWHTEVRTL
jgi:hypothetical protein